MELARQAITLNKPIYTGVQILELSKRTVFRLFYDVLKREFHNVELLLTDADSILVKFQISDLMGGMKNIGALWTLAKKHS